MHSLFISSYRRINDYPVYYSYNYFTYAYQHMNRSLIPVAHILIMQDQNHEI